MSVSMPSAPRASGIDPDGIPVSTTRRLVTVFRGWHVYERSQGGPSIVDFDLCPPGKSAHFDTRLAILDALIELQESLRGNDGSVPFLRSRLGGSIAYIRTLMGQHIAFEEYVEETLGIAPTYVPDAEIEASRDEVVRWLDRYGFHYRREDRARFEREFLIHDKSVIKKGIFGGKDLWLSRLRSLAIPVPLSLNVAVRFTSVDAYWANWISGTRAGGFKLAINLHPRKRYQRGAPLVLCLHEICGHAAQMAIWNESIQSGTLNEACGITTVHSPETFVAEGLGQTVHLLLARAFTLPPELWLRKAQQYHELLVMQNAHMKLYHGEGIEHVLREVDELLPLSHRGEIEMDLRDRRFDPLSRTYQLSYSIGERTIREIVNRMSDAQMGEFFSQLFQVPMTPAQVIALGNDTLNTS